MTPDNLEPPTDGPPLLALSRGLGACVECFFSLLVLFFLSLALRVGNEMGLSAMEMEMVTVVLMKNDLVECLLLSDLVVSTFVRAVGCLNGDISILAPLVWLLDIGGGVMEWLGCKSHSPFQSSPCLVCSVWAQAHSSDTS